MLYVQPVLVSTIQPAGTDPPFLSSRLQALTLGSGFRPLVFMLYVQSSAGEHHAVKHHAELAGVDPWLHVQTSAGGHRAAKHPERPTGGNSWR